MATAISADLLTQWQCDLATDRAAAARRYLSAVRRFLGWYAHQERQPLDLDQLTPIALVGYRTALQQTEATSTVNTHVCALRTFYAWLANQGYLAINPALRFKGGSGNVLLEPIPPVIPLQPVI